MTFPGDGRRGRTVVAYLSSGVTFFYKFVFPVIFVGFLGAGTMAFWLTGPPGAHPIVPAILTIAVAVFFWRALVPLKRIGVEGDDLVVSNYREEARVPLGDIAEVRQYRWMSHRPVTVTFKTPTRFGQSIVFMPPLSFRLFGEDDVVQRLRDLAARDSPAPTPGPR